jgi:hypothetical protein
MTIRYNSERIVGVLILFAVATACGNPTHFEGEAQFPGGARGCLHHCRANNMEMATFVYVGEYSSACACRPVPVNPTPAPAARAQTPDAEATSFEAAAAAGVMAQAARLQAAANYGVVGAAVAR